MIEVVPYTPDMSGEWDALVTDSRNGTFLHLRSYMDYHADRFADCSLIARDAKGRAVAGLAACREGNTVSSHAGLTYGGWVMSRRVGCASMLEAWDAMQNFYAEAGADTLVYKPVPYIFHRIPAEDDIYALFRHGGKLTAAGASSTIDLDGTRLPFDDGASRQVRKAIRAGIKTQRSYDWKEYWDVLASVLNERYGKQPVHSLAEITMLAERFPDKIALHTATLSGELLAGVVIYRTDTVAHAQYIAASHRGKALSALPLLFSRVIEEAAVSGARYFDFGISTEEGGAYLNEGLIRQKQSYGGRTVVFPVYKIKLI